MNETNTYNKNKYGYVFNIQHYSLHDGPGIRTLVFLKGCPLKCRWCSNPESQKNYPELAYNSNKCIGIKECGMCLNICPSGAIDGHNDKIEINRKLCDNCLKCVDVCPAMSLNIFGKLMSIDEILAAVEKDSIFYARSRGGLTVSGGESLVQPEFTAELLKEAKRRRISTSMETSGYADWAAVEKVCEHLDTVFYDIKCLDSAKHKEFTGADNERILENFIKLRNRFPNTPVTARTPVIPGFNDTEEDILAIVDFIRDVPDIKYELLKYHRLGESKYGFIGRDYPLSGVKPIDDEHMESLKKIAKSQLGPRVL